MRQQAQAEEGQAVVLRQAQAQANEGSLHSCHHLKLQLRLNSHSEVDHTHRQLLSIHCAYS